MNEFRWLDECEVPVQVHQHMTPELSVDARNLPVSDALREQNDSNPDPTYQDCWPSERYKSDGPRSGKFWNANARDQCSECRCAPGHSHAKGCDGVQSVRETPTNLPVGAPNEHPTADFYTAAALSGIDVGPECDAANRHDGEPVVTARCPVCRHEMESDEGVLCDHCEEPTGVESFAVVNGTGGVFLYHLACYDEVYWGWTKDWPGAEDDCPACAALHVFHGSGQIPGRETAAVEETFDVPFPVQSWTFESLIELEVDHLHEIIDDHHDEIVKMARRRHRAGHALHGSKGYQWDAQTRLRNVLEELADAPTYLTMGSIE